MVERKPLGIDTPGKIVFGHLVAEDTSEHPVKSMTVGDLRRALEGVSDNLPVVRRDELWLTTADEASVKTVCETNDDDLGYYIEPNDGDKNRYEGKPTYPVFVIE